MVFHRHTTSPAWIRSSYKMRQLNRTRYVFSVFKCIHTVSIRDSFTTFSHAILNGQCVRILKITANTYRVKISCSPLERCEYCEEDKKLLKKHWEKRAWESSAYAGLGVKASPERLSRSWRKVEGERPVFEAVSYLRTAIKFTKTYTFL